MTFDAWSGGTDRSRSTAGVILAALTSAAWLTASAERSAESDPMYTAIFGGAHRAAAAVPRRVSLAERRGIGAAEEFPLPGHAIPRLAIGANALSEYRDPAAGLPPSAGGVDALRLADSFMAGEGSGEMPGLDVIYAPDRESRIWSADLYGTRLLARGWMGDMSLLAGLKLGGVEAAIAGTLGEDSLAPGVARAASRGTLIGPVLGISGGSQLGRHQFRALLQQSMLMGEAEVRYSEDTASGAGGLRLSEDREVSVPVSEFGVKYLYDVANNISLGLGAFASVWWDAPTAAGVYGGEPSLGDALLTDDTLVSVGGMGSIEARF